MDEPHQGSLGTSASLYVRMVQAFSSVAGLLIMFSGDGFRQYASFCLLAMVMGLMIPWSLAMATVDCVFVLNRVPAHQPRSILMVIIIIDWAFAFLSLAASCSTASSTNFLFPDSNSCDKVSCIRYYISAAMAFVCYMLAFASVLCNLLMILPRL